VKSGVARVPRTASAALSTAHQNKWMVDIHSESSPPWRGQGMGCSLLVVTSPIIVCSSHSPPKLFFSFRKRNPLISFDQTFLSKRKVWSLIKRKEKFLVLL
jgi:hypothetical protein